LALLALKPPVGRLIVVRRLKKAWQLGENAATAAVYKRVRRAILKLDTKRSSKSAKTLTMTTILNRCTVKRYDTNGNIRGQLRLPL